MPRAPLHQKEVQRKTSRANKAINLGGCLQDLQRKGYSLAEVSEACGIPRHTLCNLLYKAIGAPTLAKFGAWMDDNCPGLADQPKNPAAQAAWAKHAKTLPKATPLDRASPPIP